MALVNVSEIDLKKNFEMYDRDRSGFITVDELRQIYRAFGIPVNDATLVSLMARYDRDRSGTIGFNEFVEMVTGRPPTIVYSTVYSQRLGYNSTYLSSRPAIGLGSVVTHSPVGATVGVHTPVGVSHVGATSFGTAVNYAPTTVTTGAVGFGTPVGAAVHTNLGASTVHHVGGVQHGVVGGVAHTPHYAGAVATGVRPAAA